MGGFLALFKRQPHTSESELPTGVDLLPARGTAVPCLFMHQGQMVHTMCKIEERDETSLLLRVLREIGKVPLAGLQIGSPGQIEVSNHLVPLGVVRVQLPWITVITSPERSRPVQRQFLRVPASFTVQFRQRDMEDPWLTGTGLNLSSGGFCFLFPAAETLSLGVEYLTELSLQLTRTQRETLTMPAEVRWITTVNEDTIVGMQVSDPAYCKELANAVSRLQRLMARQPEDYLLTEPKRPHLRF